MATIYDLWQGLFTVFHIDKTYVIPVQHKLNLMPFLQCFSALRNFNELLSLKTAAVGEISCLHGLRVLTTLLTLNIHLLEGVFFLSRPINQEKMNEVS